MSNRPKVVIIGAGFGGLWTAKTLANAPVEVVLIDRHNYHTFLALLYQIAAAELVPENIIYPIRSILRKLPNVSFIMAEVTGIDFTGRTIKTEGPKISYDYLILATGSVSHFFGISGAQHTFPLKTLEDSIALRNHILRLFERTVYETEASRCQRALTFIIVGGGAAGVELAGAIAELVYVLLKKDYPHMLCKCSRVILVEAADKLLPFLPKNGSDYTQNRLQKMGVDVRLNTVVTSVTKEAIYFKDGNSIPAETVIWTAGIRGAPLAYNSGLPTRKDGRIPVCPTLQVPGHLNIFTIGDLAYLEDEQGNPLPMVAQTAMQGGVAAAQNILRQIAGQPLLPFRYNDLGTMITIGRHAAVAKLGRRTYVGLSAWLLWLSIHLARLIGFRNRLIVLINWGWNYFLHERVIRLIMP